MDQKHEPIVPLNDGNKGTVNQPRVPLISLQEIHSEHHYQTCYNDEVKDYTGSLQHKTDHDSST